MDKQNNKLITDYFKPVNPKIIKDSEPEVISFEPEIIRGYNPKTNHHHCLECGIDMGTYPGQLCRKSFCDGIY